MGPTHGTTSNLLGRGGGRVLLEPLPELARVAAEEGARPADVSGEEEHPRADHGHRNDEVGQRHRSLALPSRSGVFLPPPALTPVRDGCYPWKAVSSGIPEGIVLFTVILGRRGLAIFFMGLLNPRPIMLANQRSEIWEHVGPGLVWALGDILSKK